MSKRVLDETSKENEGAKKVVKHSLMHDEVMKKFQFVLFKKLRSAGDGCSLCSVLIFTTIAVASTAPVLRSIIQDFSNFDANLLASPMTQL